MLNFPNFDPRMFSDAELFDKQVELIKREYMALRFGKPDMANQLQLLIRAIELERNERIYTERIGNAVLAADPVVVDTEAEITPESVTPVKAPVDAPPPHRRNMRTLQPLTPKDGAI